MKSENQTIVRIFWALLRAHFIPCLTAGAKMSLSRAQDIFIHPNINNFFFLEHNPDYFVRPHVVIWRSRPVAKSAWEEEPGNTSRRLLKSACIYQCVFLDISVWSFTWYSDRQSCFTSLCQGCMYSPTTAQLLSCKVEPCPPLPFRNKASNDTLWV